MTGWLLFLALALLVLLPLAWPVRIGRPALMLVAAALFVAAAGYAWQGEPGLPGAPAAGAEKALGPRTIFAIERQRFLNKYGETGIVLGTADAFNRAGENEAAASLLRNEVAAHPANVDLRIGYAHALLMLAAGNLTPAVQLAFEQAEAAAKPGDPAAAYFHGLAELESGDPAAAERRWRALAAALPPGSPWAGPMAERLQAFEMMRGMPRGGAVLPPR